MIISNDDFIEIVTSFIVLFVRSFILACTIMGAGDNFVYSKKDLMVAGVAATIVVVMLGLGFGLTTGASLPGT